MYITGDELESDIRLTVQNIEHSFDGLVEFVEYIAIPSFGSNIILRFDYVGKDEICIDKLNALEVEMRRQTKDRYLVNMMGAVYKNCGLQPEKLNATLTSINAVSEIPVSVCHYHKAGLERDTETIIGLFQLPLDTLIWEMQVGKDDILVLALSDDEKELTRFSEKESNINGKKVKLRCSYNNGSFAGLMKAVATAYQRKVSICQVLLDYAAH